MFKKPAEGKSLQRLSGADKKKLRRTMKERFPLASDEDVEILFPAKADVTVTKYPNRALVYCVESSLPMLFDVDGRGSEIYPTVYALWKVPHILPSFELKGGEVSRYILGGADLMFPGIRISPEGLPPFQEGQPWSVKVPGNPAPIAVGSTTMSNSQAIKAGLRGKALRILHYYRDLLWESAEGRYVPNDGFFEDIVVELDFQEEQQEQEQEREEDKDVEREDKTCEEAQIRDDDDGSMPPVVSAPDDVASNLSGLSVSEDISTEEREHHVLSSDDVDALLDKCLLQALHTSVKDKDLPMTGSALWSGHILPCRPLGVVLDIKKSSHKKLSKWLQSKSSAGLISTKEDKHKKETILTSVNRAHEDYQLFRPEKRAQTEVAARPSSDSSSGSQAAHASVLPLDVVEVYKPTSHVLPIFVATGEEPGKFYTASEASDVVFRYVEEAELTKRENKAMVLLDATLCDALYKGAIKKGERYPTEVHKKEVGSAFIARMQAHHMVTRGPDSAVRKGPARPVQILTERRQGNKKVTRISGLEVFLLQPESIASELQKKFACSTTVSELPGKKGQNEVLVQGGVIEDVARHLVEHYGIPKRFIEVLDKTKR